MIFEHVSPFEDKSICLDNTLVYVFPLQACSGKFKPLIQWLYFDALECLPKDVDNKDEQLSDSTFSPVKHFGHFYDTFSEHPIVSFLVGYFNILHTVIILFLGRL